MFKTHQIPLRLLILSLLVGFMSCACGPESIASGEPQQMVTTSASTQQYPKTDTPYPSPTLSLTPTVTLPPTLTPRSTQTPGPSPTSAPTPGFGAGKVGNDFLFGNQPEGCELPCWQGLVVGESDAEDAQRMFEEAFDFGGTNAAQPEDSFVDAGVSGLLRLSHYWDFDAGYFFVSTLIQENTQELEAILLYGDGDRFEPYTSPQHTLRSMGVPSHILFSAQPAEAGGWYGSELLISYGEGVTIRYPPFLSRATEQTNGVTLELCLDNLLGTYGTRVYITPPLVGDDIDTLFSPMKGYAGMRTEKMSPHFKSLEEVFGLSLEEVTDLAQTRDNACIYASLQ